jgi:hypothetical protein
VALPQRSPAAFGVGGFSAAMPAVILQVTPQHETASAMGVNQVIRSTGFSLGSTNAPHPAFAARRAA